MPGSRSFCDNNTVKKFYVHTFGCQMNFHDSERMSGVLSEKGMSEASGAEDADLIIFNTCSIRDKAEHKFLSELGRIKILKKKNPALRIAVAGCIAQRMGEGLFKRAPHVDFLIGPNNLHKIADIDNWHGRSAALGDNPELAETELPALRKKKPLAWVSIMFGCNNFCSYCIVPFTRGREVSRPAEKILAEVEALAAAGFKEITLLGQNVNSYQDTGGQPGLPQLLEKLNGVQGIERIRFVTSHPRDFSGDLISAMVSLEKVCEHIHLPMQSGSDRVLSAMNRRYTAGQYLEKVENLRKLVPDAAITTDLIAGFPGETDEDHKATLKMVEEIGFDGVFAFKYSVRPGTAAARMDGHLEESIRASRLDEILALQDEITIEKNNGLLGAEVEVLVEGSSDTDDSRCTGRTRTNKIVVFASTPAIKPGDLIKIKITAPGKHSLYGEPG